MAAARASSAGGITAAATAAAPLVLGANGRVKNRRQVMFASRGT